mgnify:FL=1
MARSFAGTTDIPTAGTRVQISNTPRRCLSITFKARNGNTGSIYVGGSTVSSTNGVELRANEGKSYNFGAAGVSCSINEFYVDTATNGNDVDWFAVMWD